jgi:hypothetical protein
VIAQVNERKTDQICTSPSKGQSRGEPGIFDSALGFDAEEMCIQEDYQMVNTPIRIESGAHIPSHNVGGLFRFPWSTLFEGKKSFGRCTNATGRIAKS